MSVVLSCEGMEKFAALNLKSKSRLLDFCVQAHHQFELFWVLGMD